MHELSTEYFKNMVRVDLYFSFVKTHSPKLAYLMSRNHVRGVRRVAFWRAEGQFRSPENLSRTFSCFVSLRKQSIVRLCDQRPTAIPVDPPCEVPLSRCVLLLGEL